MTQEGARKRKPTNPRAAKKAAPRKLYCLKLKKKVPVKKSELQKWTFKRKDGKTGYGVKALCKESNTMMYRITSEALYKKIFKL